MKIMKTFVATFLAILAATAVILFCHSLAATKEKQLAWVSGQRDRDTELMVRRLHVLIDNVDPTSPGASEQLREYKRALDGLERRSKAVTQ